MAGDAKCDVCKRPVWGGGHALNPGECSERRGEACELHATLDAARVSEQAQRERAEKAEATVEAHLSAAVKAKAIRAMVILVEQATARAEKAEARTEFGESNYALLRTTSAALTTAEARVAVLERFVGELADEPCSYGDECPSNARTRHGRCLWCKARVALEEAK